MYRTEKHLSHPNSCQCFHCTRPVTSYRCLIFKSHMYFSNTYVSLQQSLKPKAVFDLATWYTSTGDRLLTPHLTSRFKLFQEQEPILQFSTQRYYIFCIKFVCNIRKFQKMWQTIWSTDIIPTSVYVWHTGSRWYKPKSECSSSHQCLLPYFQKFLCKYQHHTTEDSFV